MSAAAECVDRPVERQVVARHLVESGFGTHFVEVDAEGLRSIEGADPLYVQAGKARSVLSVHSL
jgi:hypothetical protein